MPYVFLHDYMEVESMCTHKCWNMSIMRILALFMYIKNEILVHYAHIDVSWWIHCLWTYTWTCVGGFLVKFVFWVSRVSFWFTRKVVFFSYTPCAHLIWGIELGLEAPWTMLSRIGLVPRVIREGLVLKAAILYHLGKLGASFLPSYHEIFIGGFHSWIYGWDIDL